MKNNLPISEQLKKKYQQSRRSTKFKRNALSQ